MFDFLLAQPMLLLGAFLCGMFFKSMILDKIRAYVVAKVAPGIIKKYLEEALGLNQDVLPAVKVVAVAAPIAVQAPVVALAPAPAVEPAPVVAPAPVTEVPPVA